MFVLGIEGSANKFGVGLVSSSGEIVSNPRSTFITPPGTGFLPRETSRHHQSVAIPLILQALSDSGISPSSIGLISFTRGPGMGGPLQIGALIARVLSQLWNIPIIGVNHCIGHIEMGESIELFSFYFSLLFIFLFSRLFLSIEENFFLRNLIFPR